MHSEESLKIWECNIFKYLVSNVSRRISQLSSLFLSMPFLISLSGLIRKVKFWKNKDTDLPLIVPKLMQFLYMFILLIYFFFQLKNNFFNRNYVHTHYDEGIIHLMYCSIKIFYIYNTLFKLFYRTPIYICG